MARTLTYEGVIFSAGVSLGVDMAVRTLGGAYQETASNTPTLTRSRHRLTPLAGLFADDPIWPEYLEALRVIRQEDEALDVT